MRLLFATTNPNKVREIRQIFAPLGITVEGLDSLDHAIDEPVEDGDSFADNALIKAAAYARASNRRCLAEDSGLVVDALAGAPGVHSARYAGVDGPREQRDQANNNKLLDALRDTPDEQRSARFICAMCLCNPDGSIVATSQGSFEGRITRAPRGDGGFGYDPLLLVPALGRTSAELSAADKNARSHRGAAARAMAATLARLG